MKNILLLVASLFMLATSHLSASIQTRSLTTGWSLVSIPINSDTDIKDYLDSNFSGTLKKIWSFDGSWKKYEPQGSNNTLTKFKKNHGYWFLLTGVGELNYGDTIKSSPLTINTPGWALVSFNHSSKLNSLTQVFDTQFLDANHDLNNISKVWGFNTSWQKLIPASAEGTLTTLEPGYAFWLSVKDTDKVVTNDNPLTITPAGSSDSSSLIIGGATTLLPPSENDIVSSLLHRSTRSTNTSTMACRPNSNTIIGYANAYSFSGKRLNQKHGSPIRCNYDSSAQLLPVTYQIHFTSTEESYLQTNPSISENIVISIELNSGQEYKSILPTQLSERLSNKSTNIINNTITETSTMSVAMLGIEIAKKIGLPSDSLQLGEINSGFKNFNSDILEVIQKNKVDIDTFSQVTQQASTSNQSTFKAIVDKIRDINNPTLLGQSQRDFSKTDELTKVLAGSSIDSNDQSFQNKLQKAKQISSVSSNLLAQKKDANSRGILLKEHDNNLNMLIRDLVQSNEKNDSLIDVADVLTQSLSLANVTSGTRGIGTLTLSKFKEVITTVTASLPQIKAGSSLGEGLVAISKAITFPHDIVKDMVLNKDAARNLASISSKANSVLKKVQANEKDRGDQGAILHKLNDTVSLITGADTFIDTLVSNAPDTETISEILSAAIDSSSENGAATEDLFEKIKTLQTGLESNLEIKIDFASIVEKSIGKTDNINKLIKNLAKHSSNASAANAVLQEASGILTPKDLAIVLNDEKLEKDFGLKSKLYISAGAPQKVQYSNSTAKITLDASNSYDPQGKNLNFQWYETVAGVNRPIINATSSISTIMVSGLSGNETKHYMVTSTSDDNRVGSDKVVYKFRESLLPVIVAPKYLEGKVSIPINFSAQNSFDAQTGKSTELSFTWSFGENSNVFIESPNSPNTTINFTKAGLFQGEIMLSKDPSNFVTQLITVKVSNNLAPVADTGFPMIYTESSLLSSEGVKLQNFSYSLETGSEQNLTYLWEPKSYFSQEIDKNYAVKKPHFIISEPGSYTVTLTVTEGNNRSSDELKILIKSEQPPFAFAGIDQVIRLGASSTLLTLDGTSSFSYTTSTPNFSWTGPLGFLNDNSKQDIVQITLNPEDFLERTLLKFNLDVQDIAGTSSDTVIVAVIPAVRPPSIVIDTFPNKPTYSSSDQITLDASLSFSETDQNLTYEWSNLSNLKVLSSSNSLNSEKIKLELPEVSSSTSFKLSLLVKDSSNRTSIEEINFTVNPRTLPPLAFLNRSKILLEDFDDKQAVMLDASSSYSRGGGNLNFQWSVDTDKISVKSSSLSSSSIHLIAPDNAKDSYSFVGLKITDSKGLSDTIKVPVLVRARALSIKPIIINAFFKKQLSQTTFLENPFFNPESNRYLFESSGVFQVFGFAHNPNNIVDDSTLSASLFLEVDGMKGDLVTNLELSGTSNFTSHGEFRFNANLPDPGKYIIEILANNTNNPQVNNTFRLKFEVPPLVSTALQSSLMIYKIESLSRGIQFINTNTVDSTFLDNFVKVTLKPSFTGREQSHPVKYNYSYSWSNGTQTPLYINTNDNGNSDVFIPVSSSQESVIFSLTAKDLLSGITSPVSTASISLYRASQLPPIAKFGNYPTFTIPTGQNFVGVNLDASASINPAGNNMTYVWKSLNSNTTFTDDSISSQEISTMIQLKKGTHFFELTVTDSVTNLTDNTLLSIEVEKEFVISNTYMVTGVSALHPTQITPLKPFQIVNRFSVVTLSNNEVLTVDPSRVSGFIKINNRLVTAFSGIENSFTTQFNEAGNHTIEVRAFYDHNQDGFYSPEDDSNLFERVHNVNVKVPLIPINSKIENLPRTLFTDSNTLLSLPQNFSVNLSNLNTGITWSYNYKISILKKGTNQLASFESNYPMANQNTLSINDQSTLHLPLMIKSLLSGEYLLNIDILAISESQKTLSLNQRVPLKVYSLSPPTLINATARDTSFNVSWSYPTGVSGYNLYHSREEIQTTSNTTKIFNISSPWLVKNLEQGTRYYIYLSSLLGNSESPLSLVTSVITVPRSPINVITTGGVQEISLNWTSSKGASIYNIEISQSPTFVRSNTTSFQSTDPSYVATNLSQGKKYYLRVSSENTSGKSLPSPTVSTVTIPPAPTNLTVRGGKRSVSISWQPKEQNTISTSYKVFSSNQSSFPATATNTILIDSNLSHFTLNSLLDSKVYYLAISAINESGESVQSISVATPTIPSIPNEVKVEILSGSSHRLSWQTSPTTTSYNIFSHTSMDVSQSIGAKYITSNTEITLFSLAENSSYFHTITASNISGESALSTIVSTVTIPSTPTKLVIQGGLKKLNLNWDKSPVATGYNLYYSEQTNQVETQVMKYTTLVPYELNQLNEGAIYHVNISAVNDAGESGQSAVKIAQTLPSTPNPLQPIGGLKSVSLSWNLVQGATKYNLYYSTAQNATVANSTKVVINSSAKNSHILSSLNSGSTYYFSFTSENIVGESLQSIKTSTSTLPDQVGLADSSLLYSTTNGLIRWSESQGITISSTASPSTFSNLSLSKTSNVAFSSGKSIYTVDLCHSCGLNPKKETTLGNWTTVTNNPWTGRQKHKFVSFLGKLWVLGGSGADVESNKVWSSVDGYQWTLESTGGWTSNSASLIEKMNNKLWVFGGSSFNQVWSSVDGINWIQHANSQLNLAAPISAVVNNKVWITGGAYTRKAVYSFDGTTWINHPDAPWPGRHHHTMIGWQNKIYVAGGYSDSWGRHKDLWSSSDGINWVSHGDIDPHYVTLATYQGKLITHSDSGIKMTTDLIHWDNYHNPVKREQPAIIQFNEKLLVSGGFWGGWHNDIWFGTPSTFVPSFDSVVNLDYETSLQINLTTKTNQNINNSYQYNRLTSQLLDLGAPTIIESQSTRKNSFVGINSQQSILFSTSSSFTDPISISGSGSFKHVVASDQDRAVYAIKIISQTHHQIVRYNWSINNEFGNENLITSNSLGLNATIASISISDNTSTIYFVASIPSNSSDKLYSISKDGSNFNVVKGSPAPTQNTNVMHLNSNQSLSVEVSAISSSAKISWLPIKSANTYEVTIASDQTFQNSVSTQLIANTSFNFNLPTNNQYFVKVRALNGSGAGQFSKTMSFGLNTN